MVATRAGDCPITLGLMLMILMNANEDMVNRKILLGEDI